MKIKIKIVMIKILGKIGKDLFKREIIQLNSEKLKIEMNYKLFY